MPAPVPAVLQLEKAIRIAQKIQKLEAELTSIIGQPNLVLNHERDESIPRFTGKRKYTFSAATLAKRAAKKNQEAAPAPEAATKAPKRKVKISTKGRAAIVAAQKARWAKVKSES